MTLALHTLHFLQRDHALPSQFDRHRLCLRTRSQLLDIIAAILALVSLLLLPSAAGVAAGWIFNLWGFADVLNAFYQANHAGILAGQLGATFFLPTVIVPLLLITHGLAFRVLLQH